MAHLTPLADEQVRELEQAFAPAKFVLGFVPNSLLTLARRPQIVEGFAGLARSVFAPGSTISQELKMLVAYVSSAAAGCRYCQAHSAVSAIRADVADLKVAAAADFEEDDQFSAAERAALRFARDASVLPNAVTATHFDELRAHFTEEQIVDMMAVIATMGWLNRWNDTMATQLENDPLEWATARLSDRGWAVGKHTSE